MTGRDDGADSLLAAVQRAQQLNYLGDPKIVRRVLAEMLEAQPEYAVGAIAKAAGILTGGNPDYQVMGPWNAEGIGKWIRSHMNGVPDGDAYAAVQFALAHLVLHQWDLIKAVQEHGLAEQAAGERLRSLMENWTKLMLGIPHVAEPDPDDVLREDDDEPEPEDDEGDGDE
jgi:hypothetical protein